MPKSDRDLAASLRFDVLDFPTAWAIQNDRGEKLHRAGQKCSSNPGWHPLAGPGFLCDCGAVENEWERLRNVEND